MHVECAVYPKLQTYLRLHKLLHKLGRSQICFCFPHILHTQTTHTDQKWRCRSRRGWWLHKDQDQVEGGIYLHGNNHIIVTSFGQYKCAITYCLDHRSADTPFQSQICSCFPHTLHTQTLHTAQKWRCRSKRGRRHHRDQPLVPEGKWLDKVNIEIQLTNFICQL